MNELLDALAKAAGTMDNPKFDQTNPHFRSKFASLAACEAVVRPRLAAEGVMYRQTCMADEAGSWLVTIGYGKGAEVELSRVPIVVVGNGPQAMGSSLTYAKRYGLCAAFGLAGEEDDDGNAAQEPAKQAKPGPSAAEKARMAAICDAGVAVGMLRDDARKHVWNLYQDGGIEAVNEWAAQAQFVTEEEQ